MSEQEKDEDLKNVRFGIAVNTLDAPEACLKHLFNELTKVGHSVFIYCYPEDVDNIDKLADLSAFVESLGVKAEFVEDRKTLNVDVWVDWRNFGGFPGWWEFYGTLLNADGIAKTQRNIQLFDDMEYWRTGEESSKIIQPKVPKIVLPGNELPPPAGGIIMN